MSSPYGASSTRGSPSSTFTTPWASPKGVGTILLPEGMAPINPGAGGRHEGRGRPAGGREPPCCYENVLYATGVHVSQEQVSELIQGLDEACDCWSNDTYEAAVAAALTRYREADVRLRPPESSTPAPSTPMGRSKLAAALSDYEGRAPAVERCPRRPRSPAW